MQKLKIAIVGFVAAAGIAGSAGMASAQTVQPGDTLSSIAAANGTTYQHLADINGIANPNVISVGQNIKTDGGSAPAAKAAAPAAAPVTQSNSALDYIAFHESTNNPNAVNPSSGTYGLFQFLPGTGPGAGASVATQYAAAHAYAVSRYGSDEAAKAFWVANQWW